MNIDFFFECWWRSQNDNILLLSSLISDYMRFLIAIGIGFNLGSSSSSDYAYYLFMSLPISVVLVFPIITPSGLHIGMILNTSRFLSSTATLDLDIRNVINPWAIHDDAVSPGWIRAYTNTERPFNSQNKIWLSLEKTWLKVY